MRLFIGLFPPREIAEGASARLRQAKGFKKLKLIDPASLHLTLVFLGEVATDRVPPINQSLQEAASQHVPFSLVLESGGVFPDGKDPRMFWTGLAGDVEKLKQLAATVADKMEALGFPKEAREFHPHLTLARARERCNRTVAELFCTLFASYKSLMFNITSLQLVRSRLRATGSSYEALHSFPLRSC